MKLNEILSDSFNAAEWEAKGYELPKYDIAAVAKKTHDEPTWVHFGAGNIFRAFPAAILNDALNTGTTVVLLLLKASTTKLSTRLIALTIISRSW